MKRAVLPKILLNSVFKGATINEENAYGNIAARHPRQRQTQVAAGKKEKRGYLTKQYAGQTPLNQPKVCHIYNII
jgi:hypothetical protein